MTQLWMWKYNGQDEVGIKSAVDKQELFRTDDFYSLATQHSRRTIGQVTDLHKVKVVDADAAVIDKAQLTILRLAVKEGIEGIYSWRTKTYPQPDESVKARAAFAVISQIVNGFSIPLTPPVTEPTGFGAIVEAEAKHYGGERTRFVRATLGSQPNWFCDTIRQKVGDREQVIRYYWSDLINPVVISEGQK